MLCRTPTPVLLPGVLHAQAVDQHCARQGSRCWRHLPFSTGHRTERLREEKNFACLTSAKSEKKTCIFKAWPIKSYLSFHAVVVQKLHGWKHLTNHELPKKLHTWELAKSGFANIFWPIRSWLMSWHRNLLTFSICLISRRRVWLTKNAWPIREVPKLSALKNS